MIRGGVGRYTMTILGAVFYSLTGISSSDVREFTNSIQNGKPLFQLPQISTSGSGVTSTAYGNAYFGTANDPNFKDPYSIQWNLSVERDLGWNTGLRVSYIALRSVQLPWAPELNQPQPSTTPYAQRPLTDRPFPYWGRINTRDTGANAIYNSLQTELTHRMRSGLTLNSAWTWAKDLSDANGPTSSGFSGETGGGRVTNSLCRRCDRGNVGSVRRHRVDHVRGVRTALRQRPPLRRRVESDCRCDRRRLAPQQHSPAANRPVPDRHHERRRSIGNQRPVARNAAARRRGGWQHLQPHRRPVLRPQRLRLPWAGSGHRRPVQLQRRAHRPIRQRRCGHAGGSRNRESFPWASARASASPERAALKFEGTFTNLPNHPNLNDPGTGINSIAFGKITSARGADSGGNRVGQFALRVELTLDRGGSRRGRRTLDD